MADDFHYLIKQTAFAQTCIEVYQDDSSVLEVPKGIQTVFKGGLWSSVLKHRHTFRMELSCLVFLVSYPSRRHRRVMLPDPANSDRFKSAKPSCTEISVSINKSDFSEYKLY